LTLFRVEHCPEAEDHLRLLTPRERKIVLDAVDEQLTYTPNIETRNRKPTRPNPVTPWELRAGNLRVCYDFTVGPDPLVEARAVGIKERNRVRIGGEIIEL
jgi:mRNA-degrading endonuclease RelE of RelBE toxin-antitoxin system